MAKKRRPERQIGTFYKDDPEDMKLLDDIDLYCKLFNKNKPKGVDGISRVGLIRDNFKSILDGVVLSNEFWEFDTPFYYQMKELYKDKQTTAIPNPPFVKQEDYTLLYGFPNRLDKFSLENKSFCYNDNKNEHKGIDVMLVPNETKWDVPIQDLKPSDMEIFYRIYYYHDDIIEIGLVDPNLITTTDINISDNEELFLELEEEIKQIKHDLQHDKLVVLKYLVDDAMDGVVITNEREIYEQMFKKTYDDTLNELDSNKNKINQLQDRVKKYIKLCEELETKTKEVTKLYETIKVKVDDLQENPSNYSHEEINQIQVEQKELNDMLNELETLNAKKIKEEEEINPIIDEMEENIDDIKSEVGINQELIDYWKEGKLDNNNLNENIITSLINASSQLVKNMDNEDLSEKVNKVQSVLPDVLENEELMGIMLSTIKKRI